MSTIDNDDYAFTFYSVHSSISAGEGPTQCVQPEKLTRKEAAHSHMIWDMGLRNRVVPISTGHRSILPEWKSAKRRTIRSIADPKK